MAGQETNGQPRIPPLPSREDGKRLTFVSAETSFRSVALCAATFFLPLPNGPVSESDRVTDRAD